VVMDLGIWDAAKNMVGFQLPNTPRPQLDRHLLTTLRDPDENAFIVIKSLNNRSKRPYVLQLPGARRSLVGDVEQAINRRLSMELAIETTSSLMAEARAVLLEAEHNLENMSEVSLWLNAQQSTGSSPPGSKEQQQYRELMQNRERHLAVIAAWLPLDRVHEKSRDRYQASLNKGYDAVVRLMYEI